MKQNTVNYVPGNYSNLLFHTRAREEGRGTRFLTPGAGMLLDFFNGFLSFCLEKLMRLTGCDPWYVKDQFFIVFLAS